MSKYITAKDIIDSLRIGKQTLYNWIQTGKFPPPIKIGRVRYWKEEEFEAWMESRRETPETV